MTIIHGLYMYMIIIYVSRGLQGNMHRLLVNVHGPGLNKLSYASTTAAWVKWQVFGLTHDAWFERHATLEVCSECFQRSHDEALLSLQSTHF